MRSLRTLILGCLVAVASVGVASAQIIPIHDGFNGTVTGTSTDGGLTIQWNAPTDVQCQ